MKRITRIILFGTVALMGLQLSPLAAHDGWVEIAPAIVERNQPATIALIQGNHSNEHKSYRIAGERQVRHPGGCRTERKTNFAHRSFVRYGRRRGENRPQRT